jgi:hypothetical protein
MTIFIMQQSNYIPDPEEEKFYRNFSCACHDRQQDATFGASQRVHYYAGTGQWKCSNCGDVKIVNDDCCIC